MNRYKKIRTIGQGQFGDVLLVRERRSPKKLYAIKAIFHRIDDEQAARSEVQVLSSLDHPNIVKYEGSFFHNDMFHIVMEYCECGDLAGIIKSRTSRPFSEKQILDWFVQASPDEKSTTRLMNSAYVTRLRENLKRNSSFGDVYSFLKASKRDGCEGSELYEALRERFGKNELSFCFQVDQLIFLEKMCERKLVGEPKILNVRRRTGRDGK